MIGRRAFLAATLAAPAALALGRRPYGGVMRLTLPLSLTELDPHAGDDAAGALLAPGIADPLYAWDANGRPYPALAASLPEPVPGGARITLRAGLVTARGRPLDARDVEHSWTRARGRAARPLLAAFSTPVRVPGDPLGVLVRDAAPDALAAALASPCTALVPRGFDPASPDGTGAFRATRGGGGLLLDRNERAARGAAYLDRIEVRRADDLASALRAFEAGDSDVGFLGAGLHRARGDSVRIALPPVAFIVLRTGAAAGVWGAPGVAARLAGALPAGRFAHLGLTPRGTGGGDAGWGGAPAELLVDQGSPYLVEVAAVTSALLSRPGHEVRPLLVSLAELRRRRDSGQYALAVDVVRLLGPTPRHAALSLLQAADPRLAEHPPATIDVDTLTRSLSLAVLGQLAVQGAAVPELAGLSQWDLGAIFRAPAS